MSTKICGMCKKEKPIEQFSISKSSKDGRQWKCSSCNRENHRKSYMQKKALVIGHYGGKCSCCGEANIEFLSIDHINGGGNKHRKEVIGNRRANFYPWLIKNNYPEGFRVLCMNCNTSRGWYGYCPHERKS